MVVPRGSGATQEDETSGLVALPRELYCPFELAENPGVSVAQQESLRWAVELGLVAPGAPLAKLDSACIGLLGGCVFPTAPVELLTLVTEWTTLFCAIDDHVESGRFGALRLSSYLSRVMAAYEGRTSARLDAVGRGFYDFGKQLRSLSGSAVARSFGAELQSLFTGYIWEEINRQHETEPDYPGYRVMRVITIGLRPQFLFSDTLAPAAERSASAEPLLDELERITCRVVGWANDIFTYEKELAQGEVHNLVVVLMRTEGLSVQAAVQRARSLHDEEVRSFLRLQARLRSQIADDEAVEYRLAHLRNWMSGHLHWALQNGRYRPVAA